MYDSDHQSHVSASEKNPYIWICWHVSLYIIICSNTCGRIYPDMWGYISIYLKIFFGNVPKYVQICTIISGYVRLYLYIFKKMGQKFAKICWHTYQHIGRYANMCRYMRLMIWVINISIYLNLFCIDSNTYL